MSQHGRHRIQLGEIDEAWSEFWVDVKPWISLRARREIDMAIVPADSVVVDDDDDDEIQSPMADAMMRRTWTWIKYQVLEWNLVGYDGEPIPRTKRGIRGDAVPVDLFDQLELALETWYDEQRPLQFRRNKPAAAESDAL